LYVTQLLGLALGLAPDALGLDALSVSPTSLLRREEVAPSLSGGAGS
jgi:heterodisulfide reductase subunit B